jgi:hypothetical protein
VEKLGALQGKPKDSMINIEGHSPSLLWKIWDEGS